MKKESLKAQAYRIIKQKILSCTYAPGMILTEERLQEDIKASKTPIRDAIIRLEQERLLETLPGRGLMVANITVGNIRYVFEARRLVEPYALLHWGSALQPQALLRMDAIFQAQHDVAALYQHDDAFHSLIVSVVDNPYLRAMYDQTHCQSLRIRALAGYDHSDRLAQSNAEHLEILQFCLAGAWQNASRAMETHLQNACDATFHLVRHGNFTL